MQFEFEQVSGRKPTYPQKGMKRLFPSARTQNGTERREEVAIFQHAAPWTKLLSV